MFFRKKVNKGHTYIQLVENRREGGRTRQRQLASLGRLDELQASGSLDELLKSGGKFAQSAAVIAGARSGELDQVRSQRIGAAVVFERLWQETGCQRVIQDLLKERAFSAPIERAVFATVLHRLVAPGSDRACEHWLRDEGVAGSEELQLHHLYRAMSWLGETLETDDESARTTRSTKDVIEERLFDGRRNLFDDLELVLVDTTSLFFYGEGGAELGARGHSKDRRPELKQLILAIVVDQRGRPICSETWPGNTADVKALLPIVSRLRERFCIDRVCVVADRGMVSSATVAELERRNIGYILGTRERRDGILSEIDVQATLKQKLDVEFRPYRILGACNPKFAHQALQAEDKIGTMLPCNVIIQQRDDQSVEVSAVDPVASMQAVDNPALTDIAKQIQGMLRRIVDEVGTPAA